MNRFAISRWTCSVDPADGDAPAIVPADTAVPVVDGVLLVEMLATGWPAVDIALVAPPSGHWLGRSPVDPGLVFECERTEYEQAITTVSELEPIEWLPEEE